MNLLVSSCLLSDINQQEMNMTPDIVCQQSVRDRRSYDWVIVLMKGSVFVASKQPIQVHFEISPYSVVLRIHY